MYIFVLSILLSLFMTLSAHAEEFSWWSGAGEAGYTEEGTGGLTQEQVDDFCSSSQINATSPFCQAYVQQVNGATDSEVRISDDLESNEVPSDLAPSTTVVDTADAELRGNLGSNDPIQQYDQQIADIRDQMDVTCGRQVDEASDCCSNPLQCMDGTEGTGAMLLQIGLGMAGGLGQTQAALGLAKACKTMKSVSTAASAMNFALAGKCNGFVNQCKQSCETVERQADQLASQISSAGVTEQMITDRVGRRPAANPIAGGYDPGVAEYERSYSNMRSQLQSELGALQVRARNLKREASSKSYACEESKQFAEQQKIAAASQAAITALAVKCQDQTETGLDSIADNSFNVDCSADAAAANPVCQQQCSRPGAESIPMCQAFLVNNPQFANLDLGDGIGSSADLESDPLFDLDPLGDEEQLSDPEFITPNSTGLATAQGSGGGGGGGLGPAGGGGGGAAGGGGSAGGALDLNSKLLRGVASGRGFSSAGGTLSGGGGFKGYSRGGARGPASAARQKGKKFNLKDFLPGGKQAKKRGLAALGSARPEIGAKTENIFKRISNRFQAVCLEDRLYDCDTLRKTKSK